MTCGPGPDESGDRSRADHHWATRVMTVGHLLFVLAASAYIAVGVRFEERDLSRDFGTAYDEYARVVPGFLPSLRGAPARHRALGHGPAERADQ